MAARTTVILNIDFICYFCLAVKPLGFAPFPNDKYAANITPLIFIVKA
jgi:hypothetical protein